MHLVHTCHRCPFAEQRGSTKVCTRTPERKNILAHARDTDCPEDFFLNPPSPATPLETIHRLIDVPAAPIPADWHTWPVVQQAWRERLTAYVATIPTEIPSPLYHGRGIVITGGGAYALMALVNLRQLRSLGCALPVLIVGLDGEWPAWQRQLAEKYGAEARTLSELAPGHTFDGKRAGWELKSVAPLYAFDECLCLDADSFPQRDPSDLFDHPEYLRTGAVLWPDLAGDPSGYGNPLLPDVWRALGLEPRDEPTVESGQMLYDRRRWWKALCLANWICRHGPGYFYKLRIFYGDKEAFHVAPRLLGLDYATPAHPPRTGGAPMLLQRDFVGRPLFGHRTQTKLWSGDADPKAYPDIPADALTMSLWRETRAEYLAAQPKPYVVGVTISVNHADYLAATAFNATQLDDWLVVTVKDDPAIAVCEEHGISYIISDRLHHGGATFNLGALRNDGFAEVIRRCADPAKRKTSTTKLTGDNLWLLSLDGDCALPEGFWHRLASHDLDPDCIYGANRVGDGSERFDEGVSGFFQLFHASHFPARRYREDFKDCGRGDVHFRDLWRPERRKMLPVTCRHLGTTGVDWKGRVSAPYGPAKPSLGAKLLNGAVGLLRAATGTGGASAELVAAREAVCRACPEAELVAGALSRCRLCGCSTWAKVRNAGETCPMGKWGPAQGGRAVLDDLSPAPPLPTR